jgi:hypothetical protein
MAEIKKHPAPNVDAMTALSNAVNNASKALTIAAETVTKVGKSNG